LYILCIVNNIFIIQYSVFDKYIIKCSNSDYNYNLTVPEATYFLAFVISDNAYYVVIIINSQLRLMTETIIVLNMLLNFGNKSIDLLKF
jgi:hypothetical protein